MKTKPLTKKRKAMVRRFAFWNLVGVSDRTDILFDYWFKPRDDEEKAAIRAYLVKLAKVVRAAK